MMQILQVVSIVLVAIGVALTPAHALEFPGKLRLPRETYVAAQTIYYPGLSRVSCGRARDQGIRTSLCSGSRRGRLTTSSTT
jgi:hypothetical protein